MSVPTSIAGLRIHALFGRRKTTHWSGKEIRQMRQLTKDHCFDDLEDLMLVERYYAAERKKGDKGIHRRDLLTFLNRYQGELDRARAWAERLTTRSARKREPIHFEQRTDATGANISVEVDPAAGKEPEPISEGVAKFMSEYEQRKGRKLPGFTHVNP